MRAGRRPLAVADALPVTVLAVIAGAGSFTHIRDTAAEHGQGVAMTSDVEAISDLRVTRKTLISLAGQDDLQPAGEPAGLSPALPGHPAYQQILDAFAGLRRPLRARDLYQALDLPIVPKNTENIRSKLKRLASRGILAETEPGLFAQPRPEAAPQPSSQDT